MVYSAAFLVSTASANTCSTPLPPPLVCHSTAHCTVTLFSLGSSGTALCTKRTIFQKQVRGIKYGRIRAVYLFSLLYWQYMSSDPENEHNGISYPMCHFVLVCVVSKSAYFNRHVRPSLRIYLRPPLPTPH